MKTALNIITSILIAQLMMIGIILIAGTFMALDPNPANWELLEKSHDGSMSRFAIFIFDFIVSVIVVLARKKD